MGRNPAVRGQNPFTPEVLAELRDAEAIR